MLTFYTIIATLFIIFGVLYVVSKKRNHISPFEMADIIERFINGSGSEWEWDDFLSSPINDHSLDKIRIHCAQLNKEYPPTRRGKFTSERGLEILQQYIRQLRTMITQKPRKTRSDLIL